MGKQAFSVNVTADEVIAPGSTIELAFAAPVEEKSAQGAIRVTCGCEPRSVRIEVAKRGRLVRVNVDETVLGACRLVIAELLGAKGERLVDAYGLPFSVAPLPGKLPAGLRVEHAVRLLIGDLHVERVELGEAPAGYVDLVKAVHRTTGRPAELGFDERGKRVDVAGLLEQLAARRAAKYGRIHETLYERLEQARGNERIPIVVWPRLELPPAPYSKATDRRTLEAPAAEQKVLEALRGQASRLRAALKRSEVELVRDQHTDNAMPYARATATVTQIRSLAESKNVGVILFDDTSVLTDLGKLDRGCALRPGAPGRLRRHRHSRRGLGGRSQRHHEPHVRGPLHDDADGERSRAPDLGDREEHRGEPAPRPRARLRPLLGQQRRAWTRCAGPCATSTARS